MEPIDSSASDTIGWHLIARGGDMTARVHPAMQLGVLPSGDLSFEAPDAVIQLDLAGEALSLTVVSDDFELELDAGDRTRTVRVGAQTHVSLDFLGHMLDIDNDFSMASAPGEALKLYVVRKGEPRQALGPLSAPAHDGEILIAERAGLHPLKAVAVDYLQREHAAAAADKRYVLAQRSRARRIALGLAASVLVLAGLVLTALYGASRGVEQAVVADQAVEESAAELKAAQEVLDRLSALLEAEPLPDKATIDFAVESLRSLMLAYPNDPRISAALVSLNERLVQEARLSYDQGDAFRAGRLIEQATTLGLADSAVAETLAYFASQPPGSGASVPVDSGGRSSLPAEVAAPVTAEPERFVSDAEAEAGAQAEAAAREAAEPREDLNAETAAASDAAADDENGLDSLVESATGMALGAMAVEEIVEDAGTETTTDPVLEALGPDLPLAVDDDVDARMQRALDAYLAEALVATDAVSANELPEGFAGGDQPVGLRDTDAEQPLASADLQAPPAGPRFQPYSELRPVRQAPLVYPSRAPEGLEGTIDVEFTVTKTGRVIDVNVNGDAPAIFLREAARTIRNWRFAPVRQDGEVVPVRTTLRVTYRS
jgi:TonB family protein